MNRVKIWLKAFRLRTLPLSLSGIILGSFAAKADGYWSTSIFLLSLLTTILFQVLSNLANDLGDFQKGTDNENRVGPARSTQTGEITPGQMQKAVLLFTVLSIVSTLALLNSAKDNLTADKILFYAILGAASIAAAIMYTMGKKAYGYNGLGDLMVFVFFGLVSFLGVYGLYAPKFELWNLWGAAGIGLLSTAVLNLNNLRDHENDAVANKRTMVVQMGFEKAKLYHISLILFASAAFTMFFSAYSGWAFLPLLFCVPLFLHLEKVYKCEEPKLLDPELKKIALITFGIALSGAALISI
jgi:1,4-dihydroxy-2-naphthoate octaprenyltransferase